MTGSLVRVESLPAAVRLLFKRECRRLNESEARQREINSARRAAVLSRYSRNSEEPFAQNEEKTGTNASMNSAPCVSVWLTVSKH